MTDILDDGRTRFGVFGPVGPIIDVKNPMEIGNPEAFGPMIANVFPWIYLFSPR
jgi:hypothetical protein